MSLEYAIRRLTPKETDVLKASARLDYLGPINKRVQDTIHIAQRTVKNYNAVIFEKLNVDDIFSAVVHGMNNGIIDLSDVVVSEEQLESIIRTIENREIGNPTYLTDDEYRVLRARYTHSLETGTSVSKQVAERVQRSEQNIKNYASMLHEKTPASNLAQSAVIAYIQDQLIKGEDVRKQYKVSAQPIS